MGLSEKLFDRAVKVIPGGVNSPVRAYGAIGIAPRFIDRADGCHIYDVDGKESYGFRYDVWKTCQYGVVHYYETRISQICRKAMGLRKVACSNKSLCFKGDFL